MRAARGGPRLSEAARRLALFAVAGAALVLFSAPVPICLTQGLCQGGCCEVSGQCALGTDVAACGVAGGLCTACDAGAGESCVNGTCKVLSQCNAGNCGGCCNGKVCEGGLDLTSCGNSGQSCTDCTLAQPNGYCSFGVCLSNPTNCQCPSGCCEADGGCSIGDVSNCGPSNSICQSCANGQGCWEIALGDGTACHNQAAVDGGGDAGPGSDAGTASDAGAGSDAGPGADAGPLPCAQGLCPGGCCDPGGQCTLGNAASACGNNGGPCQACAAGASCLQGNCVQVTCSPANCPTGCCLNGVCESGLELEACGDGGAPCLDCTQQVGNEYCYQGQCLPNGLCQCNTSCCTGVDANLCLAESRVECGPANALCGTCPAGQSCWLIAPDAGGLCMPSPAGVDAGADAGGSPDSGMTGGVDGGTARPGANLGCGCTQTPGVVWVIAALLAWAARWPLRSAPSGRRPRHPAGARSRR